MANRRPAHRRGTTGEAYRRLQAWVFRGTVCARCGGTRFVMNAQCNHATHAQLGYCPVHPMAKAMGHKTDLQHGGAPLSRRNVQLEHFGCNSSAGARSRAKGPDRHRSSWSW